MLLLSLSKQFLWVALKHILKTFDIDVSVTDMPSTELSPEKIRQRKRTIGIIAIALLLLFTVLALLGFISLIVWVLADLAVALIANLLLRRVGRVNL